MNFKIVYPGGYQVQNVKEENIDVNIVLENLEVYFATFFTISNVKKLLLNCDESYFWATDMIIVEDLRRKTIQNSISEIINDENIDIVCSHIGSFKEVYGNNTEFDNVVDMTVVANIRDLQ